MSGRFRATMDAWNCGQQGAANEADQEEIVSEHTLTRGTWVVVLFTLLVRLGGMFLGFLNQRWGALFTTSPD
jgi:hypothetical protein